MELIIVRHGNPNYELDRLTEKGIREATLLSDRFANMKFEGCYSSPLGRAKHTAEVALSKTNYSFEVLDWLHEFRGRIIYDGVEWDKCWDQLPSVWTSDPMNYTDDWYKTDLNQSVNVEEEYYKVIRGLDELLEKHGYKRDGKIYQVINGNHDRIICFCHFGVAAVMCAYLMGVSPMPLLHNSVMLTSSVTTFVSEERREGIASFRMTGFGDISHLYAGNEEPSFIARFCECYDDDTRHD